MTANTDRCSRSWRGKQWSGKLKGAGSGPAECQASDSCVRLPRHRRSASLTSSMSAERSRSLKTTTLVAWQLSAGSESAALCFLLFAGAVNLRERGQRQTEDAWAEVKWHFQRFGFLAWKAIKKWNRSEVRGSGLLGHLNTFHSNICQISITAPASSPCSSSLPHAVWPVCAYSRHHCLQTVTDSETWGACLSVCTTGCATWWFWVPFTQTFIIRHIWRHPLRPILNM